MDYETAKVVMIVFNMILTLALTISSVIGRRQRATVSSIKELEAKVMERLDAKSAHISRIEVDMQKLPSFDHFERVREISNHEIVRLHERMDDLQKAAHDTQLLLGDLNGQLKQLNRNTHG